MTASEPETVVCSVCVANYQGIGLIDACIASVRAQTLDGRIEIIIHDDASTDGSAAHIRAHHPDVHLIESVENVGFCIANNRMATVAQGRYLLLLNNDARLWPDALRTLQAEAIRLGRPAILGLPQYDADSGDLLDIGSLLDPFLNVVPNLDPMRGDVGLVAGACLWIDRSLWLELGGFPEWFGSIAEDLHLCCRARLAGHPVRCLGVSGYRHHVGQSFGGGKAQGGRLSTTYRRRALSERNKTFVMVMTYPAPLMYLALPVHLALLMLEGAVLSIFLRRLALLRTVYLPVFAGLIGHWALLCRGRRIAMESRRIAATGFFAVFVALPQKLRLLYRHGLPRIR